MTNELSMNEEKCRNSAAACLGTLCTYLQENQVAQLLEQHVFGKFYLLFEYFVNLLKIKSNPKL